MSLGWFLSSRFGSRGSPVVPGHANHWFLTARRQFSAPDHGQSAAPAAHSHLVTPPHLPGLSLYIRHRYRSLGADLTSRTAEETGICRRNIHGQNNRNTPERAASSTRSVFNAAVLPHCRVAVLSCCWFAVLPCCRVALLPCYAVFPCCSIVVLPCCRDSVLLCCHIAVLLCCCVAVLRCSCPSCSSCQLPQCSHLTALCISNNGFSWDRTPREQNNQNREASLAS